VSEEEGGPVSTTAVIQEPIRSTIPARLDRLGWSKFHTRMVCGLGAAWILDGLQITIASSVTGVLTSPETLGMTSTEIGLIASVYLVGQIIGALVFGRMSDQLGRRRLLIVTLLLYLLGTGAAAFVTGHHTGWLVFFYATRLVAGMGIGGQYAAINSAIDEMMPSKYRGRVDIWINGSYWAGAILGSFAALIFLNAFAVNVGWRLAFLMGPVLALVVVVVARTLPESPRWLLTHGRVEEAERELAKIEEVARRGGQELGAIDEGAAITLVPEQKYGYLTFLRLVFRQYPKRAILGRDLDDHPVVPVQRDLLHLRAGPHHLLWGERDQGPPLRAGVLDRQPARPADPGPAVRLDWPQEDDLRHLLDLRDPAGRQRGLPDRQRDLADRDPVGGDRGVLHDRHHLRRHGTAFYGWLIGNGSNRTGLFIGYLVGAGIMIIGGIVELLIGINAEGKSLEAVTKPLTAADD
jgi:hypothetical protein